MHKALHANWEQVLLERGDAIALIEAESGTSISFNALNDRADQWLAEHSEISVEMGAVWCVTLAQPIEWMMVCLAAIKAGTVFLPLEAKCSATAMETAREQAAACLIDESGVQTLLDAVWRPDFFLVKLTSGSTGKPKALPFTEAEMMADGAQIMQAMGITAEDRNYAIIPLGHSYGLGNLVMPFFLTGVSIVFASSPFPHAMVEEIARYHCTVLPLVPPLVKALVSVELEEDDTLRSLRLVLSAGSILKSKCAERFYKRTGKRVHNFYGSSETGGICFDREGNFAGVDSAIGEPLGGVKLSVDEDQSIRVRSAALCHAVYPDGACRLHDLGVLDAGGVLHLHGRSRDVIKVAGRRVSLVEIETTCCALDGVVDAYVSSREGRTGELRCVVLYCGSAVVDTLRAALLKTLPEWKVPKFIRKVDAVVYTARGKKDRPAMEAQVDALIGL